MAVLYRKSGSRSSLTTFLDRLLTFRHAFLSTMSERHLTKGSSIPPFTGKMRVYNMRFCPYAQRTILVLNAKKIPYEIVNINLNEKPEWLVTKSPLGKVPAIEINDGVTIYESLVTSEYLDDAYPENPLTSKDPLRKAQDKLIIENFNKTIMAIFKLVLHGEKDAESYFQSLDYLQNILYERSTKFIFGATPGMVDYMIWPWIERMDAMSFYGGDEFNLDDNKYSTLIKYINAMKQDPAVKPYLLDIETHQKYLDQRKTGSINYDFLLD